MVSRTENFCIDAADPKAQTLWWAQVLDDFVLDPEVDLTDDDGSGDDYGLVSSDGRALLFLRVPEPKTVKNRMHLCVRPVNRSRDDEVDRLLGLGATIAHDLRTPDSGWAVLSDLEGNEFCVLTTPADKPASAG